MDCEEKGLKLPCNRRFNGKLYLIILVKFTVCIFYVFDLMILNQSEVGRPSQLNVTISSCRKIVHMMYKNCFYHHSFFHNSTALRTNFASEFREQDSWLHAAQLLLFSRLPRTAEKMTITASSSSSSSSSSSFATDY
jgi:hypothetical protein